MTGTVRSQVGSVVVFSAGDWWIHSHGHADLQLAKQLASSGRSVLIVNSMGLGLRRTSSRSLHGRALRKIRSVFRGWRRVDTNLAVFSPLFLPVFGFGPLSRLNARAVALQVAAVMLLLRFGTASALVANPTAGPVAASLRWRSRVFYQVDDYSKAEEANSSTIDSLVHSTVGWSDRVLYSSNALYTREKASVGEKAIRFPHGVDLSLFNPRNAAAEPGDLASIPHPRVCSVGNLETFDRQQQIAEIAELLPEIQFVLVGNYQKLLPELRRANIHLLGKRPHEAVPRYLQHVDIGLLIVPRSEWGDAAEPVKLKEYLAMGLPVVANTYAGWTAHDSVIRAGGTPAEIADLITATLHDGGPSNTEARLAKVAGEGWDSRSEQYLSIVRSIEASRA